MDTANKLRFTVAVTVLLAGSWLFAGCSGCQKDEAPPPPPTVHTPQPEPAPAQPEGPEPAAIRPMTLDVLQLMPESAALAGAMPSWNVAFDKTVALLATIAPGDMDVAQRVDDMVAALARDLEVEPGATFSEVLDAKGIDPDAPVACFMDFARVRESLEKLPESTAATTAPGAASPSAGDASGMDDPVGEVQVEVSPEADTQVDVEVDVEVEQPEVEELPAPANPPAPEAPDGPESAPVQQGAAEAEVGPTNPMASHLPEMAQTMEELGQPAIALVMGYSDADRLNATLREVFEYREIPLDLDDAQERMVGPIAIQVVDPEKFCYFLYAGRFVCGNSAQLVEDVAKRFENPAELRYGTTDRPPDAADEFVELVRLDRMGELLEAMTPLLAKVNPQMGPMFDIQQRMMADSLSVLKGSDPAVVTMRMEADAIVVRSFIDFDRHPDLKRIAGDPVAQRLAGMLPPETLLMLSLGMPPESKAYYRKQLGALAHSTGNDPGAAMAMAQGEALLNMLGGEFVLAVTGVENKLPTLTAMLALANPEQGKMMLGSLLPSVPEQEYNGTQILKLAYPTPIPVFMAYVEDVLVVSMDREQVKTMADMIPANDATSFLSALEPPITPGAPAYSLFVMQGALFREAVMPHVTPDSGVPRELAKVLKKMEETVEQVSSTKTLDGTWQQSEIVIRLK